MFCKADIRPIYVNSQLNRGNTNTFSLNGAGDDAPGPAAAVSDQTSGTNRQAIWAMRFNDVVMILASTVRHRTGRPAIRMEGGQQPMKRMPTAVCFTEISERLLKRFSN